MADSAKSFGEIHMLRLAIATVLLFTFGALNALATADESRPELPESQTGQIAAAWIKLFETDSDDAVRDFEATYGIPVELKWADVRLDRVLEQSEYSLSILVTALPCDDQHLIEFEVRSQPPHGLLGIGVRGPIESAQLDAAIAPLDAKRRESTVKATARTLRDHYVFPDMGEKMASLLEANAAAGRYDHITQPTQLARMLTDDLQTVCHDKHLRVRRRLPVVRGSQPTEEEHRARERRGNFGFVRTEVLPGNIGYIKFNGFSGAEDASAAAAAAMAFVERCDALIFDVRENGGGSPRMIEFLCSYLFPPGTHLNSFKDRDGSETGRTTTHDRIPGKKFADDLPVYVLTSSYTFSAAEEFTYNLQQTKRATIVGETTGGGAHPVNISALNRQFEISIPFQRAENPISKTNWEGTGIVPEIKVAAGSALEAAQADALQRMGSRARSAQVGMTNLVPSRQ